MLTTNILLAEKYDYLSEKFKKAFTFLRDTDLAALPVGNVPIDGNEVYANVQSYSTMDAADCPFESHKEFRCTICSGRRRMFRLRAGRKSDSVRGV